VVTDYTIIVPVGVRAEASAESLDFPHVSFEMIGPRNFAKDDEDGVALRANLVKADYCGFGLYGNGPWDNANPDYLTRQELYDEILAAAPDMYMTEYTNPMEEDRDGTVAADLVDWLYDETGPTGAEAHWITHSGERTPPDIGSAVNDHWTRRADGEHVSTFGTGNYVNTNITDYTTIDGSGRRFPQRYGDWTLAEIMYVTTPKDGTKGSVGAYGDVMGWQPKTNWADYNGDGSQDNARDEWQDGGQGETSATKWRAGYRDYFLRLRAAHPNMLAVGNWTEHLIRYAVNPDDPGGRYNGTDMGVLPIMHDEYDGLMNGGHVQNACLPSGSPESGVFSDGTKNPSPGAGQGWQFMYNTHVQAMLASIEPHLCSMDWRVVIGPSAGTLNPGAGTVFHLARWGFATVCMDNGFFALNDSGANYKSAPLLDETGLINTGTTGISKGWGGQPIDDPQRAPTQGSNIWMREFANMLVVLNTDWDRSGSATTVLVSNLPGGAGTWKRLNGSQDSTFNDNSTVNSNFSLGQVDAVFLERV